MFRLANSLTANVAPCRFRRPRPDPGRRALRWVNRWVNRVEVAQLRRTGRSVLSVSYRTPALVLETTGRRTGRRRATPLAHRMAPDGTILVVGGAAGMTRTPDWVANLRTRPEAAIVLDRTPIDVVARELTGPERAAAWTELAAHWPRITRYQRRAGRTVPVFRLSPSDGAPVGTAPDSWPPS